MSKSNLRKTHSDPDEVAELLGSIDLQRLRWELKKLREVDRWARQQQPIKVGDRVEIRGHVPDRSDGWWIYREALVDGALATVEKIEFFGHLDRWMAAITLDKEWSVHEWSSEPDGKKRYYKEGAERGTFTMALSKLRRIKDKVPA